MKPIYDEMNILQFHDIYRLEVGKLMYKFKNDILPENFQNYFKYVSTIHNHNTRTTANLSMYPIRPNTKFSKNTLKYKGVEVWNSIPVNLKRLPSVKSFSRQMKTYILN